MSWSFNCARSLIVETGSTKRLGELLRGMGVRKPFVVTDPGVIGAGLLQPGLDSLQAAGLDHTVFGEVLPDPSESVLLAAAAQARADGADCVLGFGGGSSMDIAKLVALTAQPSCDQPISEMYAPDGAVRGNTRLPLVQVPTTAGTGSEVTMVSVITTGAAIKKGVISPLLLPDIAVLDGELTASLPAYIAGYSAVDAMVHAIEAYTSAIKKNPLSDVLSREALRLLSSNLAATCDPASVGDTSAELCEARGRMLLGSCYAGMSFANAPVAAVHGLALPIGANFHVPHGLSNALVLPHVLEFNAGEPAALEMYAELAPIIVPALAGLPSVTRVSKLIEHFHDLPKQLGLPTRLTEVGVAAADLPMLAAAAMKQTRLLPNNPRVVTLADATRIYEAAL